MPVNDPTQIENDFDLRTIDISTIESIEIIRGAASSLYGSAATTAVIKITTKRLNTQGLHGSIRTIFGTNNNQKIFECSPNHQNRQLQLSLGMNTMPALFPCSIKKEHWVCHLLLGMRMTPQKNKILVCVISYNCYLRFSVNAFFNQAIFLPIR